MKLKKLLQPLKQVVVKGSREIAITGLCSDSRCVAPGNLFVAKKGGKHDGTDFIAAALSAGAVAILTDIYNPVLRSITQIIVPDVPAAEALLAAYYYREPSDHLFTVGITGTNGKTTTAYLTRHLLTTTAGISCGLMGSIEVISGVNCYRALLTTADIISNHKMLREMVLQGCKAAVMEVSSHALDQGRVAHIHYDVALFTNLTSEHLDYHGTLEHYAKTKSLLFANLQENRGIAVVNSDDPYAPLMLSQSPGRVLRYGIEDKTSQLQARDITWTQAGLSCLIAYEAEEVRLSSPFIGRHNVYNLLAAIAVGLVYGIPLVSLVAAAATASPVPGRLEAIPNSLGLNVYVDYAHKEAALRLVLETLRPLCQGRLIAIFGCGGNRDRGKRPRMAAVCEELCDFTIVTSDNPRNESPTDIVSEIVVGFTPKARYVVELDRRAAIARAIAEATPDDIILIAGKGHEAEQIFAHTTIPFDDKEVVSEICGELSLTSPSPK